ncbi:aspartate ammonia-lyase [Modestobacter sp. VKM Ac-2978]|uniref:aspartate ammonia-lyase n=1 Tax=Modestobacter sp. VKM Ac-2978 TaxID=3004132 RepID=UPI0022AA7337|nr:aspartate ammonia-lyase [Modestobacter sp. VKM Ac-2978]MCZ2849833.1 aspartate ammonia-lyase [Modestobacter sp. VKM Ac-2978]
MISPLTRTANTRPEHDLLGDIEVPMEAYYGAHTARALDNFPISGAPLASVPHFVRALATVKQAAATANRDLGLLPDEKAAAIVRACEDVRGGALHDQFVVDLIQGGAGTSSNMNANEVLANRALEHLGVGRGSYAVLHPLEHVNLGQSTNDVYPTAVKLALDRHLQELLVQLGLLRAAFSDKAAEFAGLLKIGRTQLQDAVPMTLGQEFSAIAVTLAEDEQRLAEARLLLHELNLGGTAIGTALNAHPQYRERALAELRTLTGIETLRSADDLIEATQDVGVFVQLSGVLKRVAVKLSKICNDLRLLSSGPRAGLNEINLPPRQAGSSIMPGKVNPVIPEVVNQIAFEVIGNDVTVTLAAEGGQLQLNAFEPIIARALFASLGHLTAGVDVLTRHCVRGITANEDQLAANVASSIGLVTALSPLLGYETATAVAQEAQARGCGSIELVIERGLLTRAQVDRLLAPEALTGAPALPTVRPTDETGR